ncbi:MAG: PBP1A family penicillin-binding protein [Proteobacteria bacterium]|nr:PBP1A family penicillin-binding protein [Pseudomonadota bacterium]
MKSGFILKILLFVILSFWLLLAGFGIYIYKELPDITELKQYKPNLISRVYSEEGELIGEYYVERRIAVPIDKIPPIVIKAFLAAEDARFFEHHGMDIRGIIRATIKNILAGAYVQGGSTITQQLARSLFLSQEKTIGRKFKELILAYILDNKFSKQEILQLYLNHIYLGNGAYGVEMASQDYFGKSVKQLNIAEAALIAGLPKAPSTYSPFKNPGRARKRRDYVLSRMFELGFITESEYKRAIETPLPKENKRIKNLQYNSHLTEYIKQNLISKYGEEKVLKGGLTIFTSINAGFQRRAYEAIDRGLRELDKRQGFRGPIDNFADNNDKKESFLKNGPQNVDDLNLNEYYKAIVEEVNIKQKKYILKLGIFTVSLPFANMQWAVSKKPVESVLKPGDIVYVKILSVGKNNELIASLEQEPLVEGALLSIDPNTGYIKALIGGRDFIKSQFNRAIQAKRQPGSSFKPFIYGAAIERGFTPVSIIIDEPISYDLGFREWAPKNFDGKYYGPTTLRHALAKSRNVITIKLLESIGTQNAIDFAKRAGIESKLEPNLALALGASDVTLYEMVNAYTTFASMGKRYEPQVILKVVDSTGNILEEASPKSEQTISPSVCYVLTSMAKSVIEEGTAMRAKALGRPVAGKTGTTNNYVDAWFLGYTPNLVTGVWVGFDQPKPLGNLETGARAALPIWLDYTMYAESFYPPVDFIVPEGVTFIPVDAKTGLLASSYSKSTRQEVFIAGTEPKEAFDPLIHLKKEEYLKLDMDYDEDKKHEPGW